MKTFIHNPNVKYLLNFFKKKSSASSIENKLKKNIKQKKKNKINKVYKNSRTNKRTTHIITELYQKNMFNQEEETKKKNKNIILNMNIFAHLIFKGIGISISNHNLEEILYFSMEYILIIYKQMIDRDLFHINIGWLQIDNHTKNTDYKNVLLPIVDLQKTNK